MIGQLHDETSARAFSDFLYAQGIENEIEPERGAWVLWIRAEDQIGPAATLLNEFRSNPAHPRYREAARLARERQAHEAAANKAAAKRFFDRNQVFPTGIRGIGALTMVLVAACGIVAALSKLGSDRRILQPLHITEYWVGGDYVRAAKGLPEVRQGQVWRLVTPIFIHFGAMHLIFNMLWLLDLGTMVERRQSWRHLALLVLIIGVLSNVGQYLQGGPAFGGMSGVVYGLIGYVWMRGKFDATSGLFLHSSTVTMAVVWYVLCLQGLIPNIANTAHTVGFAVGLAWGFVSAQIATRR